MALRVQILGATRLARVAVPYVTERRGCRVVAIDPGDEHEAHPWFAPVRGLARDEGAVIGRAEADLVLDCDPDARPTRGEGPMLRVLAPAGARSPDVNRALLDGGAWSVGLFTPDGAGVWATRALDIGGDADAMLDNATLRAVEALDDAWDALIAGAPAPAPDRPLVGGRFRAQETFLTWQHPADRVTARIRACAGPFGGARTHVGEATVFLLDARVVADVAPTGFDPGVIVGVEDGALDIATGRGVVRVERIRPGWRPPRSAAAFASDVGIGPGYQIG
ncbi:MAG: hypothetical protein ACK4YP_07790 [Myxococcota bacterium]